MTSTAIQLARECFGEGSHPIITVENAERFYARAQAQALRDAAEKVDYGYGMELDMSALLRLMADELKGKA